MTRLRILVICLVAASCAPGRPKPAALDTRNDLCASCRMPVSAQRFASQVVAPGEDPLFFDDLGCLVSYLDQHPALPGGSVAYVADHRSGDWVAATAAVFTRSPGVATPMGSHLLAHASDESRRNDPAAQGGAEVSPEALLSRPFPDGAR